LLDEATRSKPMALDNMFVDVGADSREEVKEMGIMPGNMIVPICPFTPLGNGKRIMAKAWDNRLGTGLAIQLLHELKAEGAKLPNILYTGATVQEEVGLRGAKTAVDLIQPDLAYALDVGPANDATGDKNAFGQLGAGTLLRVMDRSIVTNRRLVEFVLQTAEDNNIPYQFFISPGGTDAGELQFYGRGVPVAPLGIVARYIHSAASIMHSADYDAAKELLIKLVKLSDRQLVKDILPY
jgi:putative aminopeptidase FrvX